MTRNAVVSILIVGAIRDIQEHGLHVTVIKWRENTRSHSNKERSAFNQPYLYNYYLHYYYNKFISMICVRIYIYVGVLLITALRECCGQR